MRSFFDYFQVASLLVFTLALIFKALYSRFTAHINPIAIGRVKRGFQLIFELTAFLGVVVWIVEVLSYSLHTSFRVLPSSLHMQLTDSVAARAIGVVLISLGLIILIWAFVSFGNSWRMGLDLKTPGRLVTTGIFAVSRNPIYIFLDLWFVGTFLINGTLIFLIFALLAIISLHYQMLREEKFLAELYGRSYEDYRARTGRYVTL